MTKQELVKIIVENFRNENGDIDLTELDFSSYKCNIFSSYMKVDGDLWQNHQNVKGDLIQSHQKVEGDLYQCNQKVEGDLVQSKQNVEGDLYQDFFE